MWRVGGGVAWEIGGESMQMRRGEFMHHPHTHPGVWMVLERVEGVGRGCPPSRLCVHPQLLLPCAPTPTLCTYPPPYAPPPP